MNPLQRHLLAIGVLCLLTIAAYLPGVPAYFGTGDDFIERHRAAFEDAREPARIFTTSHFGTMKYRPLNRLVNFLTYRLSGDSAKWYRIRNISFHVINVLLVYTLGCLLLRWRVAAFSGALLFGVHPLANQSVMGAVMTNTMGHAAFLASLALFLAAARKRESWRPTLALSMLAAFLSILFYDPAVAVFGIMAAYILLFSWGLEKPTHLRELIWFSALSLAIVVLTYLVVRSLLVPHTFGRVGGPSVDLMVTNAVVLLGGLVLPIDCILANKWFGTPLPSELDLAHPAVLLAAVLFWGVAGSVATYCFLRELRSKRAGRPGGGFEWRKVLLLISAILCCLGPVVLLVQRPSETYLYLPVAFYALLVSYVLAQWLSRHSVQSGRISSARYWIAFAILVALALSGTLIRNRMVVRRGETAKRVASAFRSQLAKGGFTHVLVAETSDSVPASYGIYRASGVRTISSSKSHHLTLALQLVTKNEGLRAEYTRSLSQETSCSLLKNKDVACFRVYPDGRVEPHPKRTRSGDSVSEAGGSDSSGHLPDDETP